MVDGAGSLVVDDKGTLLLDAPELSLEFKSTAAAQAEVLNRVRQERDVNWTFISPAALFAPGERTGGRMERNRLLVDAQGQNHISMEDYAIALVDELAPPNTFRKVPRSDIRSTIRSERSSLSCFPDIFGRRILFE